MVKSTLILEKIHFICYKVITVIIVSWIHTRICNYIKEPKVKNSWTNIYTVQGFNWVYC